jgi:hypothetical protein
VDPRALLPIARLAEQHPVASFVDFGPHSGLINPKARRQTPPEISIGCDHEHDQVQEYEYEKEPVFLPRFRTFAHGDTLDRFCPSATHQPPKRRENWWCNEIDHYLIPQWCSALSNHPMFLIRGYRLAGTNAAA